MASAVTLSINISDLPKTQATALRSRAQKLGMSPEQYVKELIVEDARLDALASSKSFAELAMPFRKALAHMSESELDALAKPHKRKGRR
jgi:hypothetical protein